MPPDPLRVAIADDHYLVREGTRRLLESAGVEVVASVADGEALLEAVEAHRPDAVLTDVRMPPTHGTEGIDVAREIRRRHPEIGVPRSSNSFANRASDVDPIHRLGARL